MIIIDASIAIKWVKRDEKYREIARIIYERHKKDKEKILVPDFLYIEVANVLSTKSYTSPNEIKIALDFIFRLDLISYKLKKEDVISSALLAKKSNVSVYDMLYAVVAKKHKTTLITADEQFIKKTKFSFVKHISQI